MRALILAVLLLVPIHGHAQDFNGVYYTCLNDGRCLRPNIHAPSGDANLDRAIKICDDNQSIEVFMTPQIPHWKPGYEACAQVSGAWERSRAAQEERERQKKEDADRAFVGEFAKSLAK